MGLQQGHKKAGYANGSVSTVPGTRSSGPKERVVRYKECMRNHAANIGGYAVDGCTEFMASGAEGTAAAYVCAACNCHRSFHKREVESDNESDSCDCSSVTTASR